MPLVSDPISARIDSYLAALSDLEACHRAALSSRHSAFQHDIVTLIGSGKHLPDGATVTLYRQERRYQEQQRKDTTMPAEGIRIIQMQQTSSILVTPAEVDPEMLSELDRNHRQRAEAELSQAFADGYEITNVTVGGNERVLLTVWTLKLVVTLPKRTIPEIQPTAIRSTRL